MFVNESRTAAQMLVDNVPGAPRKVLFPTSFVVQQLDHCASLGDWAGSTTTSEGARRRAQKGSVRNRSSECPLSATLGRVGEWWTLLILHDAFDGYTRFDQFQANLGTSSSLLTSRLKRLVDVGLLERRKYQTKPVRHEYVLTELGRSLRPVIVALAAWGNARLDPSQRSMVLIDSETGVEAQPILVDRVTGRRVDGPDFIFTAGPAASEPFRDRYAGRPTPASAPGDSSDTQRRRS